MSRAPQKGTLLTDENGQVTEAVVVQAGSDPALFGVTLHHAYFVIDFPTGLPACASNAVAVTFVP